MLHSNCQLFTNVMLTSLQQTCFITAPHLLVNLLHLSHLKVHGLPAFRTTFHREYHKLRDWKMTERDWRNKEKIRHLSSPNNHWQHKNNRLGQQKFIPHARVGLVGHLSWHSSSLAFLPQHSPFFSTIQLKLTDERKSWRIPDTPIENSTRSPMIAMPGNGGSSTKTRNWEGKNSQLSVVKWCNSNKRCRAAESNLR